MKIAYFGLRALADPSQHTSNMRQLLDGLAARGHEVISVTAAAFSFVSERDVPRATERLGFAPLKGDRTVLERQRGNHREILLRIDGKRHLGAVIARARDLGDAFGPEVLVVSARSGEAAGWQADIPTTMPVVLAAEAKDGSGRSDLPELAFVTGRACEEVCDRRLELPPLLGKVQQKSEATPYVTFVAPTWENGAALFFQAAQYLSGILATQKFLVVQSEGQMDRLQAESGLPLSRMRHLNVILHPWFDLGYLDATKVLVMPSLKTGTDMRPALEALARGIPVIGSTIEPLGSLLAPAEAALEPSRLQLAAPNQPAASSDVLPWALALSSLLTDEEFHAEQSATAREITRSVQQGDHVTATEAWLAAQVEAGR